MPNPATDGASPQFVEYLHTLRRRKWTILVVTVLAVAAALGFSKSQTPIYDASAKVLIQDAPTQSLVGGDSGGQPNIADEIQRLQSPSVADIVRAQLHAVPPPVSGRSITTTDIMVITTSSTSPVQAARVTNDYANAFIKERQSSVVSGYVNAEKAVQGEITHDQNQLTTVQNQITTIQNATAATTTTTTFSSRTGPSPTVPPTPQLTALNSQASQLDAQIGVLQSESNTLQADAAVGASAVQLLLPARVPSSPSTPKTVRNGLVGLGGGLLLGVALAFVRESLDDTINSKEDLDRRQPGLPVLGAIPAISTRGAGSKELVAGTRPHSYGAEAYRSLRTSVQFLALDQPIRILQVTSPRTSEGKTTTVGNLAVTLAAAGQRVVIVDCDLRRSRVHDLFGLSNKVGFTSVLMGEVPMSEALQPVADYDGLFVLASGQRPPNPAELLSSTRSKELFAALANLGDIVIVDCPPVLPVTDASLISARVDATLMVVSAGLTTAKDLARALEMLSQVDAPVIGAILNGIAVNAGYRYRYQYSYTPEPRHRRSSERS